MGKEAEGHRKEGKGSESSRWQRVRESKGERSEVERRNEKAEGEWKAKERAEANLHGQKVKAITKTRKRKEEKEE